MSDFDLVSAFEHRVAEFFGAPYAVATDSCTHAIELALEVTKPASTIIPYHVPTHTYLSIPMMVDRVCAHNHQRKLSWVFSDKKWSEYYFLSDWVIDAAVYWKKDGYIPATYMCLSFQHRKHLSLGRGGMVLCDDPAKAARMRKLSYDGRDRDIPWAQQTIDECGFHYYMTPETAELGLNKLDIACEQTPRAWSYKDYPDISNQPCFRKCHSQLTNGPN